MLRTWRSSCTCWQKVNRSRNRHRNNARTRNVRMKRRRLRNGAMRFSLWSWHEESSSGTNAHSTWNIVGERYVRHELLVFLFDRILWDLFLRFWLGFLVHQSLLSFLNAFEISNSLHFQLQSGILVADNACSWMLLQCRSCPHVRNALLNAFVQGVRLMCTSDDQKDFSSIHHSRNANSECHFGHRINIVFEESGVC